MGANIGWGGGGGLHRHTAIMLSCACWCHPFNFADALLYRFARFSLAWSYGGVCFSQSTLRTVGSQLAHARGAQQEELLTQVRHLVSTAITAAPFEEALLP